MINLQITMISGKEYLIRNFEVDSAIDFIRMVLCRNQTQLNWYEIIPKVFIKVSQIQSVEELTNEDFLLLESKYKSTSEKVIFPEDIDNQDISTPAESPTLTESPTEQ